MEQCYAIRLIIHSRNINTLKSIYYVYFHSIIKKGITFWGNSSKSGNIFTLQKKIFRIIAGAQARTWCRSLFKQLGILPVPCKYMLSLISFIINNQEIFPANSIIHNINTRNKLHLHRLSANLAYFQKVHSMLA